MKRKRCRILRSVVSFLIVFTLVLSVVMSPEQVNGAGRPSWYKTQDDYTQTFKVDGKDKTASGSGCGQTCVSMALYKMLGKNVSPNALFGDSVDKGLFTVALGTDHDPLATLCNNYGLTCSWKSDKDKNIIIKALKDGKMVIFNVRREEKYKFAPVGSDGHYVILYGYDTKTGKIGVYDPKTLKKDSSDDHIVRIGTYESWSTLVAAQQYYECNFAILGKGTIPSANLNLNDVSLAKDKIPQGEACNIIGNITSRRAIKSVKAEIVGKNMSASDTPNRSNFNIKDTNANKNLHFGELGPGAYTLRVTIQDVYGASTSKDMPFYIEAQNPSTTSLQFTDRLYTKLLKRAADPAGRKFWALQLTNGEMRATEVVRGFVNSDEFKNLKLSNAEFVDRLYDTLLNRPAKNDQQGRKFWIEEISRKGRARVLEEFMDSPEFKALCASYGMRW